MNENDLSYKIVGLALELHKNPGPGLLESAYENALAYDLSILKLSQKRLGLLINFNWKLLRDGIHGVVNNLPD